MRDNLEENNIIIDEGSHDQGSINHNRVYND